MGIPNARMWRTPLKFLPTHNCTRWPTGSSQDCDSNPSRHQRPRVIILMTPAAMVTWGFVHSVDVTNGTSLSDAQVTAPFSFHKIVHFDTQCVGHS